MRSEAITMESVIKQYCRGKLARTDSQSKPKYSNGAFLPSSCDCYIGVGMSYAVFDGVPYEIYQ